MKPTFGALNRHGGIDPSPSLNHLGLLGGTLTDVWEAAHHIGNTAGGDAGYPALLGARELLPPRRPQRLARQYTSGWSKTDQASQQVFAALLRSLEAQGVEILEPAQVPALREYEDATTRTPEFFFDLMTFELRWPLRLWAQRRPGSVSEAVASYIGKSESLSVDDYRRACARREQLRRLHRALRGQVDGFITLAHIGPGQLGQPKAGTPWYNDASSAIGAPTLSLPVLKVDELPLGVQIMGFEYEDAELVSLARWIISHYAPQLD
jgi:Asp-tRNA(Asn)/Glu-tRNA(Gln) amidotransferase A subunit family amidase